MVYLGVTDAGGEVVMAIANDPQTAANELYKKWRTVVFPGFRPEINSFSKLAEWNGARVERVPMGKGFIWTGAL